MEYLPLAVMLAASPQGQAATFTGRCPGGNGSATSAVGPLGTALAPAAYSLQAQIPVSDLLPASRTRKLR